MQLRGLTEAAPTSLHSQGISPARCTVTPCVWIQDQDATLLGKQCCSSRDEDALESAGLPLFSGGLFTSMVQATGMWLEGASQGLIDAVGQILANSRKAASPWGGTQA